MGKSTETITIHNLILRSFFHSCLVDSLKKPDRELFSTSERNITSHIRSSLEIFINFHRILSQFQVDTEYNRVGIKDVSKKLIDKRGKKVRVVPDILVHKRGETRRASKDVNFLCIEIKKIKNFKGKISAIKNKNMRQRLKGDIDKLKFFRQDKDFKYKFGISIVISDPHTIFFKINDEEFQRCSIQKVPTKMRRRFIELVTRLIFATRDYAFLEKIPYQAKYIQYEKEIDQIISSCLY